MTLADKIRDALARDDGSERSVLRDNSAEILAALDYSDASSALAREGMLRIEIMTRLRGEAFALVKLLNISEQMYGSRLFDRMLQEFHAAIDAARNEETP